MLLFCTHPYSWSSSNSAVAVRPARCATWGHPNLSFFPRGTTWDVAITRGTCFVDVPPIGAFADRPIGLLFYDGGESLRPADQHQQSVRRPRGYSCEELSGVAYFRDETIRPPPSFVTASAEFRKPSRHGLLPLHRYPFRG